MRAHIHRLAASGTRTDGRAFDEPRKLIVEKNYIKTAEGSARVRLGNTDVLVGVKIGIGEPYPDTPTSGVLTTSAELGVPDRPLPVDHWPISITAAKIRNTIVFDPALDEERIADARLTVATDENGDVRAMQKGLTGSFSYDEVRYVISTARRLGNEIRGIVRA